jgi:hypothetical protein
MATVLTVAFLTGAVAALCAYRLGPNLPLDAVIARGGLAMIFTVVAALHLMQNPNDCLPLIWAPIIGLSALALLVVGPSLVMRLFLRFSKWIDRQLIRLQQACQEYVFHRYLDRE